MQLTSIKKKLIDSISDSIIDKCFTKTFDLMPLDIRGEIKNRIWALNAGSVQDMQIRIIINLKDEIN